MLCKLQTFTKSGFLSHWRSCNSTSRFVLKEQLPGPTYKPDLVEKDRYEQWQADGFFKPIKNTNKPVFSMLLPPPNITGNLHIGHALDCTIQDVILRRKRSMDYNGLWVPGIDHAGGVTQNIVEKYIRKVRNIDRHDLKKEQFDSEMERWKEKYEQIILKQLRDIGCSLDWSRLAFTMDAQHNTAVDYAFIELFKRGLIYRKKAQVNWCQALKSTVSENEVTETKITKPTLLKLPGYAEPVLFGVVYNFAYKIFGSTQEIVVCTASPETMLGDVAVAVNPNDARYRHLAGQRVYHPFRNATIPIIMDKRIDMKFGTGAVKIAPAHSKEDYEVAKTHNLPMITVLDEKGSMINAVIFNGMKRYDCREAIVKFLDDVGFMRGVKPHEMTIPICSRTGDVVECLPKEQWFVSTSEMRKRTKDVVLNGHLKIMPAKYITDWLDWAVDDRDWCISRQLWWGHQIPAYKCSVDKQIMWVAAENEYEAREQASKAFKTFPSDVKAVRDQDVLDNWFSSAIYPFAVLGWPERTKDYKDLYPLSLMVTGHDILGFWVHRMVMLSLELTDRLPFKQILLHGTICDGKGSKMSKSKGNVIDPSDVIHGISMEKLKKKTEAMYNKGVLTKSELETTLAYQKDIFARTNGIPQCGVDAFRYTLLSQDVKSHYVNFDVKRCHSDKLFCDRIWQSVRYAQLSCLKLLPFEDEVSLTDLNLFDKWILSRLAEMVKQVNKHLDDYNFHLATRAMKNVFYKDFCDIYLETTKPGFLDRNQRVGYAHAHTITAVLNTVLRCLNPFMIYLTEELIPMIPTFEHNIIVNYDDLTSKYFHYPQFSDVSVWKNPDFEGRVEKFLSAAALVKELKGLCGMNDRLKPTIYVKTSDSNLKLDVSENSQIIRNLTQCCSVYFEKAGDKNYVGGVLDKDSEVFVEILGTDVDSVISMAQFKLQKTIEELEQNLLILENQVVSQHYLSSVPKWTKIMDREKLLAKKKLLKQLQKDLFKIAT